MCALIIRLAVKENLSPSTQTVHVHAVASVVPISLQPYGLYLCPWDFPSKNTGVGCHILLQGTFLTQGSNPCLSCLLHWQVGSVPLGPWPDPTPWLSANMSSLNLFFFMYLFGTTLSLCCYTQAFSNGSKWGLLSTCSAQVSHWGGFSCCGAWALGCSGFRSRDMWAQ